MREVQAETGQEIKALEDAEPVLHRHLMWIWRAFTDLNYRRGVSMSGACPISYSDIDAYCQLKGIYSLLERERLLNYLDVLDRHWMSKHYEKQKKADSAAPPQQRKARPMPDAPPPPPSPEERTRVS